VIDCSYNYEEISAAASLYAKELLDGSRYTGFCERIRTVDFQLANFTGFGVNITAAVVILQATHYITKLDISPELALEILGGIPNFEGNFISAANLLSLMDYAPNLHQLVRARL